MCKNLLPVNQHLLQHYLERPPFYLRNPNTDLYSGLSTVYVGECLSTRAGRVTFDFMLDRMFTPVLC